LAFTNVSNRPQEIRVSLSQLGSEAACWRDLLTGTTCAAASDHLTVRLSPYQVSWLTPADSIAAKSLTPNQSQ
jgi:hypothetical protein